MKRLDGLDLLITDWMLGFSILLLIAIKFAPSLIGQQIRANSLTVPTVLKLRQGAGPSLTRVDFKDPVSLATKLRDAREPLSQYLRGQLSSETQQQLGKYDGSSPLPESLQDALINELNRVLKGSSLFDKQRFAQITLTEASRRLIEQKTQGEELARLNRTLLEEAYSNELAKSQEELIGEADKDRMQITEVCPLDNTPLKNHECETCKVHYPMELVRTWPQTILHMLLILFVVKYIHERSVLRFRLYEDERDGQVQADFGAQLEALRSKSNNAWLHFFVFAFRILFLAAFYLFVINLYIKSKGQFQDFSAAAYYAAVLACAYFVPDLCLFAATKGAGFTTIWEWLWPRKIIIFLVTVVALFLIFFSASYYLHWNTLGGYIIFLVALSILPGLSIIKVLRMPDQNSIEITALKWLLLDVFNLIALVAFGIAANMQKIDITWIACAVLIVNLFDWLFNAWFYFGSRKFTIHIQQRGAA